MKFSLFIARFPYRGYEESTVGDYLQDLTGKLIRDSRVEHVYRKSFDDTPITMTRNLSVRTALGMNADYMLMIDNDMAPDSELLSDKTAKPFWETSIEFMLEYGKPCCVGAPYCGPPPHENVFAFKPCERESHAPLHAGNSLRFEQYTREEAAQRSGFEEVAALPTGLILIDMRIFSVLPKPWFEYEYDDEYESSKASTEDVFMTRNTALCGFRQFVNWDAWAGHWKRKCVRKPRPYTMDIIRENLREAVARGQDANERLVMVGEGRHNGHASGPMEDIVLQHRNDQTRKLWSELKQPPFVIDDP